MTGSLPIYTFSVSLGSPGIILNILILTIYLRGWYKGKHPTACDLILSAITSTNVLFQCVIIADDLVLYVQSHIMIPTGFYSYDFLMFFFLMDISFWQTALLSTYYCSKLFDSSHHLFQWMKKIISTSTNLLLLVPAVSCFLISLPFIWTIHLHSPMNVTVPIRDSDYSLGFSDLFNLLNVVLGCCLPFTMTFACITLSVGSLLKHAWNIRRNALQLSSPPQIGGLVRAASTMVSCALLDLICCVNIVVEVLEKMKLGDVMDTIRWALIALYPTARSIVLIFGNPQLKKQLGEMCVCSPCAGEILLLK